jgi:hypothetical protein
MLYSQGVSLEDLEIGKPEMKDPRKVWRIFASHYYLFRGTPTRMWMDLSSRKSSDSRRDFPPKTADLYFDTIAEKLKTPEFLPARSSSVSISRCSRPPIRPLDSLEPPFRPFAHRAGREDPARLPPRLRSSIRSLPDFRVDPQAGRADRRRLLHLDRLPERSAQGAPALQGARLHFHRPRASDRANRRSAQKPKPRGSSIRSLPARRRTAAGALPRADAHRDGADEPGRRPGHADSSRQRAQPQPQGL